MIREDLYVAYDAKLDWLQSFLDRAIEGQGQVCFVAGEAGTGKSTLMAEFARRAQEDCAELLVTVGTCNAHTGIGDPYLPFREVLALLTGDLDAQLARGAITEENASRLRRTLAHSAQVLIEIGPDILNLLLPGSSLVAKMGKAVAQRAGWLDNLDEISRVKGSGATVSMPGIEQSRVFEQYNGVLHALAATHPLLLMIDDAHWADASSIGLLFHLGRSVAKSRIMIVTTYRPEEVSAGRDGGRHPLESVVNELKRYHGDIELDLGRTTEQEARRFVDGLLDSEPNELDESFRRVLLQHTGGHPLFTVELLRDLRERGALVQNDAGRWVVGPHLDWQALPARVEGVIEERIGRLEEALQDMLTVASVEGREFIAEVLAQVQSLDARDVVERLSRELDRRHRLVRADQVRRLGRQRLSLYQFLQNLVQQYLYDSLDGPRRAYLHEDVAHALEGLYGDDVDQIAGQLAHHFGEAGLADQAVTYHLLAGRQAAQLSAYEEAIAHFTRGLDLLETLPDGEQEQARELALRMGLGMALSITKGYAASEVQETYIRLRELCQQLGEVPIPALRLLAQFHLARAEYQLARELGEQFLQKLGDEPDTPLQLEAHFVLGAAFNYLGEFAPALVHLQQVIELYDPEQHHFLAFEHEFDPGVAALSYASGVLSDLGYLDQALERSQQAIDLARQLSHPHSLAFALVLAASFHKARREAGAARERAEAAIALSTEQGFRFWLALGQILRGWALAQQGQREEGIAQLQQAQSDFRATGTELVTPWVLGQLAEIYHEMGQAEAGLATVDRALAITEATGTRRWEASLHLLRGQLLQMQGADDAEVESNFRRAIEVARQHEARSWELRATIDLSKLWARQGRREEARQALAAITEWFTEGLDTPDLKEARSLLEEGF